MLSELMINRIGWILWILTMMLSFYWFRKKENEKFLLLETLHTAKQKEQELALRLEWETVKHQESLDHELRMTQSFELLSSKALEKSTKNFLDIAGSLFGEFQSKASLDLDHKRQQVEKKFEPVEKKLTELEGIFHLLEKERRGDQKTLEEQMKTMIQTEKDLKQETALLARLLGASSSRGKWGEMQLKRIVELSGMMAHCDFVEQTSQLTADGVLRPDMIVRLPGEKQIIIDAKTPFDAFFQGMQTVEEEKKVRFFQQHARMIRSHIQALSKKSYWEAFPPSPEFVILFLPSEAFFSTALEHDPSLIEVGAEQGVVLATPSTLIGLLKAVAYGWKQETLSLHAKEITTLAQELYKRLFDLAGHWQKLGKSLGHSVEAYNKAVGSLETRVLVTARKLESMGVHSENERIDMVQPIEQFPRPLHAEEMQVLEDSAKS